MKDIYFHGGILIFTMTASAFFSVSETTLFSLTKLDKRRLSESPSFWGSMVFWHLDQPRRTLISILVGNLMANTLATAVVTLILLDRFGPAGLGPGMILFTFVLILFSEIMPKVLAVRYGENMALIVAPVLGVFATLIYPLRWLARIVTEKILSFLVHEKKEQTDMISEDELRALVKIGEEEGILDKEETHMIRKIFELSDRPVKDIMTPRIDLAGLDIEDTAAKHLEIIQKHHFSHLLVYQGTMDHILGMVAVQDYMLSKDRILKNYLELPLFIPGSKRIDELLEDFRKTRKNFAVCVDEHGGTAGIVTQEDILEEIFGEYYDEYAKVDHPIRRLSASEYIVEGKLALSEFNEAFGSDLKAEDAATIGGYVLEKTGEVPRPGQTLVVHGLEIRVHTVMRQRIRHLWVRRGA